MHLYSRKGGIPCKLKITSIFWQKTLKILLVRQGQHRLPPYSDSARHQRFTLRFDLSIISYFVLTATYYTLEIFNNTDHFVNHVSIFSNLPIYVLHLPIYALNFSVYVIDVFPEFFIFGSIKF